MKKFADPENIGALQKHAALKNIGGFGNVCASQR
jgi:hypothetical protein